jgi:hypothetical protein
MYMAAVGYEHGAVIRFHRLRIKEYAVLLLPQDKKLDAARFQAVSNSE